MCGGCCIRVQGLFLPQTLATDVVHFFPIQLLIFTLSSREAKKLRHLLANPLLAKVDSVVPRKKGHVNGICFATLGVSSGTKDIEDSKKVTDYRQQNHYGISLYLHLNPFF